jgi:uncharacterized protein YjiS (DUF1127 family)
MTHRLLQHTQVDPADVLHCGTAVRLLGRDDYIVLDHAFEAAAPPLRLMEELALWRRRYLTRRHLRQLDRRGLADIGIDPIERDCEVGKPFWKA